MFPYNCCSLSYLRDGDTSLGDGRRISDACTTFAVSEPFYVIRALVNKHRDIFQDERLADELGRGEQVEGAVGDQLGLVRNDPVAAQKLLLLEAVGEHGLAEVSTDLITAELRNVLDGDAVDQDGHSFQVGEGAGQDLAQIEERVARDPESVDDLLVLDDASDSDGAAFCANDAVDGDEHLAVELEVHVQDRLIGDDLTNVHRVATQLGDVLGELDGRDTVEEDRVTVSTEVVADRLGAQRDGDGSGAGGLALDQLDVLVGTKLRGQLIIADLDAGHDLLERAGFADTNPGEVRHHVLGFLDLPGFEQAEEGLIGLGGTELNLRHDSGLSRFYQKLAGMVVPWTKAG